VGRCVVLGQLGAGLVLRLLALLALLLLLLLLLLGHFSGCKGFRL
jgi:hypothetical protein